MIESNKSEVSFAKRTLQFGIPLGILAIAILAFIMLKGMKQEIPKKQAEEVIRSMRVKPVVLEHAFPSLSVLGRLHSKDKVNLTAEVSGKILNSNFKLRAGKNFRKGQALVSIDGTTARHSLKIQISNLMNGVSEMLPDMKIDIPDAYEKWQTFFNEISFNKIPDLPEYSSEKEKMYLTRFKIFTLYYNAKIQASQVAKYTIYAPFSGTVAVSNTSPGNIAGMGTPLATIVRTDVYELVLPLTQAEMAKVKIGMKVDVKISSTGEMAKGKIARLSSVINETNQTMEAIVEIKKSSIHKSVANGAYAEAIFSGRKIEDNFVLSRNALYKNKYVLVIKDPAMQKRKDLVIPSRKPNTKPKVIKREPVEVGRLEVREVQISYLDRDKAYISKGLKEGELVVIEATQDVIENAKVTPIRVVESTLEIDDAKEKATGEK